MFKNQTQLPVSVLHTWNTWSPPEPEDEKKQNNEHISNILKQILTEGTGSTPNNSSHNRGATWWTEQAAGQDETETSLLSY